VDGKEGNRYDSIQTYTLMFSPDSNKTAYVAKKDRKWFVVVNDEDPNDKKDNETDEKPYDDILKYSLTFSPDSNHIAYAAMEGDKWFIVVDGKEGKRYDSILKNSLNFSSNSNHIAYAAMEGKKWFMVVDGKEGNGHDYLSRYTPVFSPDSTLIAYPVQEGDKWFVIEQSIDKRQNYQGTLSLSPSTADMNYLKNEDSERYIFNSRAGMPYDAIIERSLIFSPDSKHLIYGVENKGEFIVVDNVDGKRYDSIIFTYDGGSIVFDSPDRFHYLVRKGTRFYEVEEITENSK
jgi:hypothetical protein